MNTQAMQCARSPVRLSVIREDASGGGSGPVFHAATYDPTTFELQAQRIGTGTPTFSTPAGLLLPDADGVYMSIASNTAPWYGARWSAGTPYADNGSSVLLEPLPSLYAAPELTNSALHSSDQTNAAWAKSSGLSASRTAVGLTGAANEASILEVLGNAPSAYQSATAIAGPNTIRAFIKAVDLPFFGLRGVSFDSSPCCWFNLSTFTVGTNQGTAAAMIQRGDWYECLFEFSTITDLVGLVYLYTFGFDGSFGNPTIGQTVIVGNVEWHPGKTVAEVQGSAPIITTTTAVTVAANTVAFDDANHSDTEGGYYFEFTPLAALGTGDTELLSLANAANLAYYDGTAGAFESADGTNTGARTQALTAGTTYKVGIAYGSSSLRVNVNGTWGTATSYDGGYAIGTVLSLMRAASRAGTIRDLRRYAESYADAQTTIDGLMA